MRRIISAHIVTLALTAAFTQVPAFAADAPAEKASKATKPLELAADAPERHIVVPGDTLWDISAKFLKQPYRWPELWRLNKDEIKNPHLIYPGQVLVLDRDAAGNPYLRIGGAGNGTVKVEPKMYVVPNQKAIPPIPYPAIAPFLAKPLLLDETQLNAMPRIVSGESNRMVLGAGDRIYVTGVKEKTANWHIYRQGRELKDPDSGDFLGYETVYLGSARLVSQGEPATLQITRSTFEIGPGDKLTPEGSPTVVAYVPHAPEVQVNGKVLSVYGAVGLGGQNSVVSVSKGAKDGLEVGHVLAVARSGRAVDERFNGIKTTYTTPDTRSGYVFLFKIFERVSYGLLLNSDDPIAIGDVVKTP